jgi:prepilin signal peptidase PulO-like enzyme (type II secretory pathway)
MTRWHWPRRIDPKICACGRDTPGHDGKGGQCVPTYPRFAVVPLFAFAALGGRCRWCGARIAADHVAVELACLGVAIGLRIAGHRLHRSSAIPFGPALCIAIWAAQMLPDLVP